MPDIMPHDSPPVTQFALIPVRRFSVCAIRPSGQDVFRAQIPTMIPAAICPNEIPKSRAPSIRRTTCSPDRRLKLLLIKPIYLKTRDGSRRPVARRARLTKTGQKLDATRPQPLKYCVLSSRSRPPCRDRFDGRRVGRPVDAPPAK